MLDAYTVRKAIPRLLLAVIALNLSIYLCVAALDITTILGRGINNLLVSPFIDENTFEGVNLASNAENNILGVLGGTGVLVGLIGGVIAVAAAPDVFLLGFLFPLILTVALIALAVLFTLIIRQALIIFLTVTSPIAFVLNILPGTEKYFKRWADLFIRTLAVYPIIAVIFAMSNVMAAILLNSAAGNTVFHNGGDGSFASMVGFGQSFAQAQTQSDAIGTLQIVAAILVLYAPLVLIPFSFKLAGGLMAQVMNVAQNGARRMSAPVNEAAKGYRKRKIPEKLERFKQGNGFRGGYHNADYIDKDGNVVKGKKNLRGRLNRGLQGAATVDKWGNKDPRMWRGGIRNMQKDTARAIGDEAAQKDPQLETMNGDSDALRVGLRYGSHRDKGKLRQDLLDEKYGGKTFEGMSAPDRLSLQDDEQRIQKLFKTHGTGANRAFLNKLSVDPNPFKDELGDVGDIQLNSEGSVVAAQNPDGSRAKTVLDATRQSYQAALDSSDGDLNEAIRGSMMIRSNLEKNGRGDIAHVSAGKLVDVLERAHASGGKITDDMALEIITNGVTGRDAVDQVRGKPYAVQAKVQATAARISQITKQGTISYENLNGEKKVEFEKLTSTIYNLKEGIGDTYSSAEVKQKVTQAVDSVEGNDAVKTFMAQKRAQEASDRQRQMGGGNDVTVRENMDRDERDRIARETTEER